ncbi:hypothetical protein [Mucilaginibacter sp. UR6-11]|uniref:hypothetical protein n=1 Tax=Mucilaginibacter sp. UR6-11 TaxID=1435644 RepID=UPI001E4E0876|nr:hypothetical protein [Mucilaginibacter sp. UR6-11]MCC8425297.1 hypothetical protein [Mucilaginibacter sp. UR6-11]
MTPRTMMIIRDVMYTILVVLLLLPLSPVPLSLTVRILIAVLAIATRVWQHINYYKATGKIY